MNVFNHFRTVVEQIFEELSKAGTLPEGLDCSRMSVEPPRDASHGDVSTNAAMVLCKQVGMKPRDLAALLVEKLAALEEVTEAEIAGPGFINLRLSDGYWYVRLGEVLKAGTSYGDSDFFGNEPVNVEYVSANPTGPMHVGHGRGAVFGDVLASLLKKAGAKVTKEYYINDAGAQVLALAHSFRLRYLEAIGVLNAGAFDKMKEEGAVEYGGEYLIPAAQKLAEQEGDKWKDAPEEEWLPHFRQFAIDCMMDLIREDLAAAGVVHDVFSSEKELVDAGGVDAVENFLRERDLVYQGVLEPPKGKKIEDWEAREQTLFRAKNFGDDVDRPLKKSDGSWTYFATDMAYHLDKFRRGFKVMVNVWGADHGGYVKRMDSAIKALTEGKGELDVKLCQMVNLLKDGEPVKMSKRSGNFITLREVIDEVGKDVVRFIMLTRKNDAHLDFDLAKVLEQSKDNPVFYVQYAHARIHSVLRHAAEQFPKVSTKPEDLACATFARLTDPAELALIKQMAEWPRLVEGAAQAHEPHRVAFYLNDLASLFHALWNKGKDDTSLRFLLADDEELSRARLALLSAVALVIASGLEIFGVEPVEEMR